MTTYIETTNSADDELMSLEVRRKAKVAEDVVLIVLMRPDGGELPPFTAGSHLLVVTPNGRSRRYSLCNAPSERHRYVIAVKREPEGEGGSLSMADELEVGSRIEVSPPFNYFPLAENARRHVLIAGGIGITPVLAMARDLLSREADFKLVYCTRSPEATAFLHELSSPELADRVQIHHDYGDRAQSLDMMRLLADVPAHTHLYCCGPRSLMQAVRDASAHWPSGTVHFEDFGTSAHPEHEDGEKPFSVRLARSAKTITVPPGVSILEALRTAGLDVPSSCESGTCGTCRTGLLAGVADHRDYVLDEDEQQSAIMICVSRAQTDELVLDL